MRNISVLLAPIAAALIAAAAPETPLAPADPLSELEIRIAEGAPAEQTLKLVRQARLEREGSERTLQVVIAENQSLKLDNERLRQSRAAAEDELRQLARKQAREITSEEKREKAPEGAEPKGPFWDPDWKTVVSYSGRDNFVSPVFGVMGEFRIRWRCASDGEPGSYCTFDADLESTQGRSQRIAYTRRESDGGVTYGKEPGLYRLEIGGISMTWEVVVEERSSR